MIRGTDRTLIDEVREAILALRPDEYRDVLLLYLGGMELTEIADRLGLPESILLDRFRLARRKLAENFRPGQAEPGDQSSEAAGDSASPADEA